MHAILMALNDVPETPAYENAHLGAQDPQEIPLRSLLEILLPHVKGVIDRVSDEHLEGSRKAVELATRVPAGEVVELSKLEALADIPHNAVAAGIAILARAVILNDDDTAMYGAGLAALWVARLLGDHDAIGKLQRELDHGLMLAEYNNRLQRWIKDSNQSPPPATRVLWRANNETRPISWWSEYFIVELAVTEPNRFAFYFMGRLGKNPNWVRGTRDEVLACVPDEFFEVAANLVPE